MSVLFEVTEDVTILSLLLSLANEISHLIGQKVIAIAFLAQKKVLTFLRFDIVVYTLKRNKILRQKIFISFRKICKSLGSDIIFLQFILSKIQLMVRYLVKLSVLSCLN